LDIHFGVRHGVVYICKLLVAQFQTFQFVGVDIWLWILEGSLVLYPPLPGPLPRGERGIAWKIQFFSEIPQAELDAGL
jgi:hypothetical protein